MADVKSLVRGWLQASPNIGRVKLAPSPLVSTFSPRPERLGLGAVPPRDLTRHVYQKQLEKRVERKVVGKRRRHSDSDGGFDARNGLQCPSSDEECSRSSTVRSKAKQCTLGVGSALNGRSRKRKKKKKKAPLSSSVLTLPVSGVSPRPVCTVVKDFEDPLPQRRNDLLRGGATCLQQVSPEFDTLLAHSNTGISANLKLTVPPVTSIKLSDTSCTKDEEKSCVKQINEPPPACGSPPKKGRQRSTNRRRRQLRRMSVHRGQPLLWSRLSRSHVQRRQLYVRHKKLLQ